MMIAIAGCGAGRQEWTATGSLTREAPRIVFAPPGGFAQRIDVAVLAVDNPARSRFVIRVSDGKDGKVLQDLSLYPADEPGSFLVLVPVPTERIAVEAQSRGGPLPRRITVQVSATAR